jgi:cysteine desulfurase / selenocysteine lyase
MNTSDPPGADPRAFDAERLTAEVTRLAGALFSQVAPGAHVPAPPPLPAPPTPGPAQLHAPLPRESDLRSVPALLGEHAGFSSPVTLVQLASPPPAAESTPYYLALAGPPTAPTVAGVPTATTGFSGAPVAAPNHVVPAGHPVAPAGHPAASGWAQSPASSVRPRGREIFDPYAIKRDFPILSEQVHGRPLVWLDNAATTQKPRAVIDRISHYYLHENSNVHRAAHTLAARATDAYEVARETTRRFLNAATRDEIVFTRGATEAINLVAQSWGRRNVGPGDEIVITWLEHHANIVPWQRLVTEQGARLRVAPVDDRGQIILEEYEKVLGPRTRLVALPQVSNALGTVTPAREMVAAAHRHGAKVLVDGAQAVSHMPVDVQSLDCDFYCFSGHKVFAPMGIGVLFGKTSVLRDMPPWQGGGNMIRDVSFDKIAYQDPPLRFEAGTGSIGDAVGLGAALDYLTGLGLENVNRYEHELLEYGTAALACVSGLRMIGTAPDKAGVLSFTIDGVRTEDIGAALDQEGIAVRAGHHCAQPILRRFGLESTVRASLAPYNTREDLDALVAALQRIRLERVG